MSLDQDKETSNDRPMTRLERMALARAEQKEKMKQKAKAAKKAYLARPEVQAKIASQKEKLAEKRKAKAAAVKATRKAEKKALSEAKKITKARHQKKRDEELVAMLGTASHLELTSSAPDASEHAKPAARPQLTVILGGRSTVP